MAVKLEGIFLKQDKVSFTDGNVLKVFIVYELDIWSRDLRTDLTLKYRVFGAVILNKNVDPDKYSYSEYCIGCDSRLFFLFSKFCFGKNVIYFGDVVYFCSW